MKGKNNIITIGGITWIISGILFLVQNLFLLPLQGPPALEADLLVWLEKWKFNISMADEVLLFAALFLIPAIFSLYQFLVRTDKVKAIMVCGLLASSIPIFIFLDIILGRLVYPVYNLELSADIYKLVLSIYYGGMHLVAIVFSIATLLLSIAIRKSEHGKAIVYFGFVVAVADLISAFPWITGSAIAFACQLLFSAWFVLLGVRIIVSAKTDVVHND
jgi:hypothetical protein